MSTGADALALGDHSGTVPSTPDRIVGDGTGINGVLRCLGGYLLIRSHVAYRPLRITTGMLRLTAGLTLHTIRQHRVTHRAVHKLAHAVLCGIGAVLSCDFTAQRLVQGPGDCRIPSRAVAQ